MWGILVKKKHVCNSYLYVKTNISQLIIIYIFLTLKYRYWYPSKKSSIALRKCFDIISLIIISDDKDGADDESALTEWVLSPQTAWGRPGLSLSFSIFPTLLTWFPFKAPCLFTPYLAHWEMKPAVSILKREISNRMVGTLTVVFTSDSACTPWGYTSFTACVDFTTPWHWFHNGVMTMPFFPSIPSSI